MTDHTNPCVANTLKSTERTEWKQTNMTNHTDPCVANTFKGTQRGQ